jgi:hypothetical protein
MPCGVYHFKMIPRDIMRHQNYECIIVIYYSNFVDVNKAIHQITLI